MTASVGNIVLYILFLWIAPVFVGNAICNRLSMRGRSLEVLLWDI